MKLSIFSFLFSLTILILSSLVIVSKAEAADACTLPFMGIGLGWNLYKKDDVTALGNPWVYNWSAGKYTNSGGTGDPTVDFGDNYIPMIWGCNSSTAARNWITANNYSGPLLFLNEPDLASQANCPVSKAVPFLADFLTWKQTNNKNIDVYLGGNFAGPNWLNQFIVEWRKTHTQNPDIAGVHFHMYNFDSNHIGNLTNQLTNWENWLKNPSNAWAAKNGAWVTEYGVLSAGDRNTSISVIKDITKKLYESPVIAHAAWFVLKTNYSTAANYDQTSLINQADQRTSLWNAYKDLCSGGYCQPKGTCTSPSKTPAPTIKPTTEPSPTPKPTTVPTPTTVPSPTNKPTTIPSPTVKPSTTPSPTAKPTVPPTTTPEPTAIPCEVHPTDMDCSGKVTATDLSLLLQVFGTTNIQGDFDGSGRVTALDISILLQSYGKTW